MERSTPQRSGPRGKAATALHPEGRLQSPAAVLPGPPGQGLSVVAGISQDEAKALNSLLDQLLRSRHCQPLLVI